MVMMVVCSSNRHQEGRSRHMIARLRHDLARLSPTVTVNLEIPLFFITRSSNEGRLTALSLLLVRVKNPDCSALPKLNAASTAWLTRSRSWPMQPLQDDDPSIECLSGVEI
jgi:hypothetical protein